MGWLKRSYGVSHKMLHKNPNEFLANPIAPLKETEIGLKLAGCLAQALPITDEPLPLGEVHHLQPPATAQLPHTWGTFVARLCLGPALSSM